MKLWNCRSTSLQQERFPIYCCNDVVVVVCVLTTPKLCLLFDSQFTTARLVLSTSA